MLPTALSLCGHLRSPCTILVITESKKLCRWQSVLWQRPTAVVPCCPPKKELNRCNSYNLQKQNAL